MPIVLNQSCICMSAIWARVPVDRAKVVALTWTRKYPTEIHLRDVVWSCPSIGRALSLLREADRYAVGFNDLQVYSLLYSWDSIPRRFLTSFLTRSISPPASVKKFDAPHESLTWTIHASGSCSLRPLIWLDRLRPIPSQKIRIGQPLMFPTL